MSAILAMIKTWFNKLIALFSRKKNDEPIEEPEPGPGEVVCYYGCPNSKKAKKLQLSKKIYR